MNRERRKRLQAAFEKIAEVQEIITDVRDEEQEAFENLPESFQYGEKGEEMQGYIEMLDETNGYLDDAKSVVEQI